jgi:tRNA pseudouridine55 synthase
MTEINGLLNINKPSGVNSYWVVNQVKKVLGIKKVGHCGTLDPLADGVLVVLFGKATKCQDKIMGGIKTYRALLKLGITTDTGDITGKTLKTSSVENYDDEKIKNILTRYIGEIEQIPPMYSALKYGGIRLYEFARLGREVPREARKVNIDSIKLLSYNGDQLEIRVVCSKGTYIRTLAEDIGNDLGCGATIQALCRERSGEYSIEDSVDGKRLQTIGREELLKYSMSV